MPAFFDGRCPQCGKRFGWVGEVSDRPPCPQCGKGPDPQAARQEAAEIERFRQMLQDRRMHQYAHATPGQQRVFDAGYAAYRPGAVGDPVGPANPYHAETPDAENFYGWYIRGWIQARTDFVNGCHRTATLNRLNNPQRNEKHETEKS